MSFANIIKCSILPIPSKGVQESTYANAKLAIGTILVTLLLLVSLQNWIFGKDLFSFTFQIHCALSSVIQFVLGIPLYWRVIKKWKSSGGKLPLLLASLTSFVFAIYFWSPTSIKLFTASSFILYIATLLFSLEQKAIATTESFLHIVQQWQPQTACKKIGSNFESVPISDLNKGDIIKVLAGQMIPKDGTIITGTTSVDESTLTGEFKPLLKGKGDSVIGSTLNRDSEITIQLTKEPSQNILDQIIDRIQNIHGLKLPIFKRSEAYCKSIAFLGILVTLIAGYYFLIIKQMALPQVISILIATLVSFSAFSLATSVILASNLFLGKLIKHGILLKRGQDVDTLAKINTLFFDKTGTITKGNFEYAQSFIEMGTNQGKFLSTVFSLESQSDHPFSQALETHPWYNEIPRHSIKDYKVHPGLGICGYVQPKAEKEYFAAVGNLRFLKRMQMFITRDMKNKMDDLETMGETVLLCGYDKQVKGLITFSDNFRPHLRETLLEIQKLKIEPAFITGDSEEALAHLSVSLGITKVTSRCTPEEKAARVGKEKNDGKIIGYVGEQKDNLAFEKSDINISTDLGTDITDHKADVLIMGSDFKLISWLLKEAKSLASLNQFNLIRTPILTLGFAVASILGLATPELITTLVLILNLLIIRSASLNIDQSEQKNLDNQLTQFDAIAN